MFSLFILVWLLLAFLLFWRPVKAFLNWLPKVVHYLGSSQKEEPTVSQKNKSPISLKFCDYIFLLRVPIIGGLILFCFPFIAQSLASRFLQNLFVMDSGIKMIMVTVFTTLTAITIVSLIKSILVLRDKNLNDNKPFLYIRTILTFALFLPTWVSLLLNKEPNIKGTDFGIGVFIGFLVFLGFQIYDYREIIKNIPILKEVIEIYQKLTPKVGSDLEFKRSLYIAIEIILGLLFYVGAICFNWPQPDGQDHKWQAPTLLYALLIIWFITLLVGVITYFFDTSFDEQRGSNSSRYDFHWPVILLLIVFSGVGYGAFGVDHYFKLENSQVVLKNYQQDFQESIWNRLCDEKFDINDKKQTCNNNNDQFLVVVAASGGGIQASGWMAQVLAGLQDKKLEIGEDFTKAIGLISSASGGSVGSMFYLDQFDKEKKVLSKEGLGPGKKNPKLYQVVENATDDWLNSVGWGLAYPDLFRAIGLPVFLNPFREKGGDNEPHLYLDRGYALEKNWQKTLTSGGKEPPTLDSRRKQILEGKIPITVYNTTLVENGRRFLVSPMKFVPGTMADYVNPLLSKPQPDPPIGKTLDFKTLYNNCGNSDSGNKPCDLALTTAARLSASFPYVTPMARNDRENFIKDEKGKPVMVDDPNCKKDPCKKIKSSQNYHIADGGYFDNYGAFTAMEWVNNFLKYNNDKNHNPYHHINIKKVLLLQINAFPEEKSTQDQKGSKGFEVVTLGPINTLAGVRDSTQLERNQTFAKLLEERWNERGIEIKDFTISFPEKVSGTKYDPPLSWRLTKQQKENLVDAWRYDKVIAKTVQDMKTFWNGGKTECKGGENVSCISQKSSIK